MTLKKPTANANNQAATNPKTAITQNENNNSGPKEIVLIEHFNKEFKIKVWVLLLLSLLSACAWLKLRR